jgi:hypothetical protein
MKTTAFILSVLIALVSATRVVDLEELAEKFDGQVVDLPTTTFSTGPDLAVPTIVKAKRFSA